MPNTVNNENENGNEAWKLIIIFSVRMLHSRHAKRYSIDDWVCQHAERFKKHWCVVYCYIYRKWAHDVWAGQLSIVSGYWLDDRAIEIWYPVEAKGFFLLSCVSRPALGSTQPPVQWVPGVLSPGLKRGRGVTLTTQPHLVPRSRMSRSYTPLPPSAFVAYSWTAFRTHNVEVVCLCPFALISRISHPQYLPHLLHINDITAFGSEFLSSSQESVGTNSWSLS
jgi:hypothetical protein